MKVFAAIALFALLLCGCQVMPDHSPYAYEALTKDQEVRIVPARDPEAVRVLKDPAELDAFFDLLDTDDWDLGSLPRDAVPLGTITFSQTETLKLGQRPEDRTMELLCTLTIYDRGSCIVMDAGGLTITLSLPTTAAACLRSYF